MNRISVQFSCLVMSDSLRPHEPQHARPACPSPTPGVYPNSCPLSRWCHPTILSSIIPFLPALNLSQHRGLFQWVSSSHQVAKVSEFQLQHRSFQWIFRLISFRIDWCDLLAVQGTLKSLLQHHSLKASILQHSAFFIVQLSHQYMTTGKIITLTRRNFVSKIMSLLFHMLSRLVIAFLPSSKRLNFMAAVTIYNDFGVPQNKVCHCFHCFPIYFPWSDGARCHDLSFLNVEF